MRVVKRKTTVVFVVRQQNGWQKSGSESAARVPSRIRVEDGVLVLGAVNRLLVLVYLHLCDMLSSEAATFLVRYVSCWLECDLGCIR
jgi:hypothetical protein